MSLMIKQKKKFISEQIYHFVFIIITTLPVEAVFNKLLMSYLKIPLNLFL